MAPTSNIALDILVWIFQGHIHCWYIPRLDLLDHRRKDMSGHPDSDIVKQIFGVIATSAPAK